MKKVATLAVCVALLTGCSTAPDYADTYRSVEELRDAFVRAGGECDEWQQENRVAAAAESGTCNDSNVLSIYASQSDRDEVIENLRVLSATPNDTHLLVGENWIINDPNVKTLDPAIGGTLVTK